MHARFNWFDYGTAEIAVRECVGAEHINQGIIFAMSILFLYNRFPRMFITDIGNNSLLV